MGAPIPARAETHRRLTRMAKAMTKTQFRHTTHNEAESERMAGILAKYVTSGLVILLNGDLGAGKTVMARGIIRGLGVEEDYITSPTFTLLNIYMESRIPVYHFDLYRLDHPDALAAIGAEEYLEGEGVVLAEWAEKGGDWVPYDHLSILLEYHSTIPEQRHITLTAQGPFAQKVLHAFQRHFTQS